jgi:hypothetical protein
MNIESEVEMELSDMELNEWLAVEVMGWEKEKTWVEDLNNYIEYWTVGNGIPVFDKNIGKSACSFWNPCTDLNQAWKCVIETAKRNPAWDLGIYKIVRDGKVCASAWIDRYGTDIVSDVEIENKSPARAICEAVWLAKKGDKVSERDLDDDEEEEEGEEK